MTSRSIAEKMKRIPMNRKFRTPDSRVESGNIHSKDDIRYMRQWLSIYGKICNIDEMPDNQIAPLFNQLFN